MSGRYTVIRTNDCIVIEGAAPVTDVVALMRAWGGVDSAEWIADACLAQHLRASIVVGPQWACHAWRERLGIVPEGPPRPPRDVGRGNTQAEAENGATTRYRLVSVPAPGITCLACGHTSYNSKDIAHKFCAHCDDFLED